MPDSIAASTTFALASASMRQPKLLQPSPTTEISSEPILRVCIGPKCGSDAAAQASRSGDFQVAEGRSGDRPSFARVAHASRVLAMTSRHRGLFCKDCFGETPKVRAGLA